MKELVLKRKGGGGVRSSGEERSLQLQHSNLEALGPFGSSG